VSHEGISESQARSILAREGENLIPSEAPKTLAKQILVILSEPMLILLIAAGVINFLLAEVLDALMLMVTVFIVLGISIYQSSRSEKALQALKELSAPTVKVIRDGAEKRISSKALVVGDLMLLSEGDRVCADAVIISSISLAADESTVTGESIPVDKNEGESLLSGTLITRGHGTAEVSATGVKSQLGAIGKSLQEITTSRSRLQRDVDQLVRVIGVLGIITVISVVTIYGSTRNNWLEGGLAGIAAAMALIPEEFPVILTLFMAIGAWRISKEKVITRQPSSIESLGSISVLCVDKTGTITENHMTVKEISSLNSRSVLTTNLDPSSLSADLIELIEIAALACPIRGYDPMDIAFLELSQRFKFSNEADSLMEFPVEKSRLAYIHIWKQVTQITYAAKGAPETIIKLCQLDVSKAKEITATVHEAAGKGFRVIAVAKHVASTTSEISTNFESLKFEYLGLALLQDPIRAGVKESVAECRTAGIKTIMITGDHPNTAAAIAHEIGLDGLHLIVTGDQLDSMDDRELATQIAEVSVFARVKPEHKLRIVRALQASDHVVGMTGDGVNDAPALRAADIGIAMGGRGTDVAREAAALIITDDNYNSIVRGIKRGRATYANLQKAMSYVIAIHIPIFGLALLPIFSTNWPLILLPGLVAFHEVIIDPACSVVFEEESPDPKIMEEQPRKPDSRLFSRREIWLAATQGFSTFLALLSLFLYLNASGRSEQEVRSMIFGALMISNIFLILTNRSRSLTILQTFKNRNNRAVPWILALALGILFSLILIPPLRTLFDLGAIAFTDWLVMFIVSVPGVLWYEIFKMTRVKSVASL
jgi:Ca2+-transporting ATPase